MIKRIKKILIRYVFCFLVCFSCSNNGEGVSQPLPKPVEEAVEQIKVRQLTFPSSKYVMVAVHRGGYKGVAPENSLKAIKKSLELGVDIIEIDVRVTVDNKLAVIHDKTLERTTTGTGKVSHHTLDEITALNLKDENGNITEEKVPTLKEVLEIVGNKAIVFIDKAELVLDKVEIILNETNSASQALFLDFVDVKEVKSRYGDLLKKSFFVPGVHDSNSSLEQYVKEFEEGFNPNPSAFAFWFKDEGSKSFALIGRAQNNNIPVWINTTTETQSAGHTDAISLSNPDDGWGWVLNKGANILLTDYPEQLLSYLEKKDLRN